MTEPAIKFPNATHYSPHFSRAELNCGCGCSTPLGVQRNLELLALRLEELRACAGHALHVNCAYRCPKRNAAVGGASHSFHLVGLAADIDGGGTRAGVDALADAAMKIPAFRAAGIGRYYEGHGLFVHVDIGDRLWRGVNGH